MYYPKAWAQEKMSKVRYQNDVNILGEVQEATSDIKMNDVIAVVSYFEYNKNKHVLESKTNNYRPKCLDEQKL